MDPVVSVILAGGFKPSQKYESQLGSSLPGKIENQKYDQKLPLMFDRFILWKSLESQKHYEEFQEHPSLIANRHVHSVVS